MIPEIETEFKWLDHMRKEYNYCLTLNIHVQVEIMLYTGGLYREMIRTKRRINEMARRHGKEITESWEAKEYDKPIV